MNLVPSFVAFLQPVAPAFTVPTFHRVFSAAGWSLDELGLAIFTLIEPWLPDDAVLLSLDDTLARKRGRKVFGGGVHHDPLLSRRKTAVMNRKHNWVVLGVIVTFPFRPGHAFSLPILFRLYVNPKTTTKKRLRHPTRPELAVECTAPTAMLLYSLIVLWFAAEGQRHYQAPNRPWSRSKSCASFADRLTTLRCESVREQVLSLDLHGQGSRNIMKTLLNAVQQAA